MTTQRLLRLAFGFLAALSAVPRGLSAQPSIGAYAAVKTWYGSYSYTVSGSGTEPGGRSYTYAGSFQGSFVLKQSPKHANVWGGPVDGGQGQFHYKLTIRNSSKSTETQTIEGSGPTIGSDERGRDPDVELRIYPGRWTVHIMRDILPVTLVYTASDGSSIKAESAVGFPASTEEFPLPESGTTLERKFIGSGPTGGVIPWTLQATAEWKGELHLSPTPDDFVLEVTSEDYDKWRPSATATGQPGTALEVMAALKRKSGAPAGVEVSRMEWELVQTSREPGIAINYPLNATDANVDLRFDPHGSQESLDPDRQKLVSTKVENGTDVVSILPLDWGGWSTLRVTAYIRGGPKVVGVFKQTGDQDIRLPKRRSGSFIADAWRTEMKNAGKKHADDSDNSDDEKDAKRGGFPGDGLTLYEEYRGFYQDGTHQSGDPDARDLFVLDKTDHFVDGGIEKFHKESGIVVHRMKPDEFDETSRIVNKNRSSGPHVVDQHGILIVWREADDEAEDAGGAYIATVALSNLFKAESPGYVKYIEVPNPLDLPANPPADDGTPYNDVSFAHEMMHAVGVRHHGEGNKDVFWKIEGDVVKEYAQKGNGDLVGAGVPIIILNAKLEDVTSTFIDKHPAKAGNPVRGQAQYVGVKHGESSGDVTCMMRYDRTGAYIMDASPNKRVLVQEANREPIGYAICKSPKGTGINAPPAESSRYGDATKGDCAGQLRVSDRR